MDAIFDFGLEATRWLQSTFPFAEGFFSFISLLGIEEFYLALFPLVYWSIHKNFGKNLAYLFLLSNSFNAFGKHGFRGPQPFWLDNTIGLDVETSYGVPSGHVQGATLLYLFLASWVRRQWVWLLALLMIVLMMLSRVYLGVHFVHDVGVGFTISLLVVIGYWVWRRKWGAGFGKRILGYRLMIATSVPLVFAMLYAIMRFIIGAPDLTVAWAAFIPDAELDGVEGFVTAVSSLFGIGIGLILEKSRVRFRVEGAVWKRIVRYLLGLAGAVLIWGGLKAVFPSDPLWLAIPLRFVRYTLLTLWISYYAPIVFIRLNLADADPDPGIDLSI